MDNLDETKLDPGITALVLALRAADFKTTCSCQGGHGHMFALPTVRIRAVSGDMPGVRLRLVSFLIGKGFSGFNVSEVRAYQSAEEPWPQGGYIELVIWGGPRPDLCGML